MFPSHTPRHRVWAAAALTAAAALSLTACGGSSSGDSTSLSAYNKLITSGPVASAATVQGNTWATSIKKQGYLKVGGTDAGPLFSIKKPGTDEVQGFDAGLSQMLARYITGKGDVPKLTQLTITTVDTRETLLKNHTVNAVFATYTITPARAQLVNFAGPYYEDGDAIMVKSSNTSIKTVKDLNGKKVVTEADSTAVADLKQYAPGAKVTTFQNDAECLAAVQQGRADAYVLDQGILLSDASANPAVKVVGTPFTSEPYGIGLPKDEPAAKTFVNAWLKVIYANGDWAKLWKATIGTVVKGNPPTPPTIGSADGS